MGGHIGERCDGAVELVGQIGFGQVQVGQAVVAGAGDDVFPQGDGVGVDLDAVKAIHHWVEAKADAVEGQGLADGVEHLEEEAVWLAKLPP